MNTFEHYTGTPRIVRDNGRYVIIGMEYGYARDTMGTVKVWRTYSGAHKALKKIKGQ